MWPGCYGCVCARYSGGVLPGMPVEMLRCSARAHRPVCICRMSSWLMHGLLLDNQAHRDLDTLAACAFELGPGTDRFRDDLLQRPYANRVARDVECADISGVVDTPRLGIDGRHHESRARYRVMSALRRRRAVEAPIW